MSIVLRQTGAMFYNAYRELSAGRLFWITLALSTLVALIFASVGVDEEGMSILGMDLPFPITSEQFPPQTLYKFLFLQLGIGIWLTWAATILALITTASIIPSLVSSGVIDSMVSKPISRTRTYLTRFATGLLFAALQVTLFTSAAFLVLGLRGDTWLWGIFLAIPIVIVFYSYLFSVMSFVGLITKSTITSLLVTLLLWFFLFILNFVDNQLVQAHENSIISVATVESRLIEANENAAVMFRNNQRNEGIQVSDDYVPTMQELHQTNTFLPLLEQSLIRQQASERMLRPWARGVVIVKTIFPKTGETIGLLNRIISTEDISNGFISFVPEEVSETKISKKTGNVSVGVKDSAFAVEKRYASRSLLWVLGTSLGFVGIVLGISCWIFARRDF